jgi:hypothetical protein
MQAAFLVLLGKLRRSSHQVGFDQVALFLVLDRFPSPPALAGKAAGPACRLPWSNCEAAVIGKPKIVGLNYGGADASCCVDLLWLGLQGPWPVTR